MAGLGTVREGNSLFLSIAGGFIWDRKADESDPNYATQEFDRADGTKGERSGARYADLTGLVKAVDFKVHPQFGENINVTIQAGEETYILSVSTNNRFSQDLMKALLVADLSKPLFIKPYDFVGSDKKRAMGISFRQDGEKLKLQVEGAPFQEGEWFKTAGPKKIKRFFEDLSEWYVNEVTAKVSIPSDEDESEAEVAPKAEKAKKTKKSTPKKAEVIEDEAEVDEEDLDSQLDALLG